MPMDGQKKVYVEMMMIRSIRGGRMLAAGSRQGMTDLPLFHPECGGSQPTGFPSALQISARQREGKSNNAD